MNKPESPPIPPDGIYWVKWANRTYKYGKNSVIVNDSFWELGDWEVVQLEDGKVECFGSDELIDWNGNWYCVAVLGPKVEAPE